MVAEIMHFHVSLLCL